MNSKLLYLIFIIVLLTGATIFITIAEAENLNLFCSKKQSIIVTLKNEAEIEKSKAAILKIPQVKITKIKYRDEEWSKMVNKMDLPNMENPFKNEFIIKISKNTDTDDILNKMKEMGFVEKVECLSAEEYKKR